MSATARATRTDPLAKILLRRSGLAVPGLLTGTKVKDRGQKSVATAEGLVALEADVLARGYLVGPRLRAHLAGLPPHRLAEVGSALCAALAEIVGGGVPHIPLFRDFPRRIPADTQDLYVRRVFALLLQEPSQPCVLCGVRGLVRPVSPCAHLVCESCWDMGNYSGCPICHRRCDAFFDSLVPDEPATDPRAPLPSRAAVLEMAEDVTAAVYSAVGKLLERHTPPSPQDRDDLAVMLDFAGHGDLHWLPGQIPVRETRALVLARLVADPGLRDRVPGLLDSHVTTATVDLAEVGKYVGSGDTDLVRWLSQERTEPMSDKERKALESLVAGDYPRAEVDEEAHELIRVFEHVCEHASIARDTIEMDDDEDETPLLWEFLWSEVDGDNPFQLPYSEWGTPAVAWHPPEQVVDYRARFARWRAGGEVNERFIRMAELAGLIAILDRAVEGGHGAFVFYEGG